MKNTERSSSDEVIDLTEARNRAHRAGEAHHAGLSRHATGYTPPWRAERTASIVERPIVEDHSAPLPDPAELRHSLFANQERVITARPVNFKSADTDRSLGKPNGTLRQRFLKR